LCRYLHTPLQSGSDEILHNMNRRYTLREFDEFINLVHDLVPGICLGTDVIVGFPGETDAHFEQTYQNLLNADLAYFHVFSYSERPWTKSRKLEAKVSPEIIEQRSRRLRELSDRKRRIYLQGQLGTIQTVLFEQIKKGYWTGLTDTYVRVKVKSNNNLQNQVLPVQMESIEKNTIIGKLL
ncbi:MAG: radical SAM protein, partial [Calditrichota bacterium]